MTARRARPSSSVRLFYKRLSDVWDADFAEALEDTGDKKYARATQILGLLDLHPRIREHVKAGRDFVTLRRLVALLPLPPKGATGPGGPTAARVPGPAPEERMTPSRLDAPRPAVAS